MTTVVDYNEIKEELVVFLRNSNIYTTAARNVTTATATGALIASATITISASNVKNIRSVTIGATPFTYGSQYLVDYDASGTCVITLYAVQTDTYSVSYDYGTDKIFSDMPRADLSLSSFPRIAVDMIGDDSEDIELGAGTKLTTFSYSIYVYDFKVKDIDTTLKAIRTAMIANQKLFYYQKYVTRLRTGPLMVFNEYGQTKVMLKSIDYISKYNLEYA
jgi:hypothetical protein